MSKMIFRGPSPTRTSFTVAWNAPSDSVHAAKKSGYSEQEQAKESWICKVTRTVSDNTKIILHALSMPVLCCIPHNGISLLRTWPAILITGHLSSAGAKNLTWAAKYRSLPLIMKAPKGGRFLPDVCTDEPGTPRREGTRVEAGAGHSRTRSEQRAVLCRQSATSWAGRPASRRTAGLGRRRPGRASCRIRPRRPWRMRGCRAAAPARTAIPRQRFF